MKGQYSLRAPYLHDQTHPGAMMMHAFASVAEIPKEAVLPKLKAMEATAKVGWNPYLHDPKLEGPPWRVTAPPLGRRDGLVPLAYGQRWRDRIADARLEVIEGCGHLPPVEGAAEFAVAVLRFLA